MAAWARRGARVRGSAAVQLRSGPVQGGVSLGTRNARQKDFIRLYTESYGTAPDLLASQAYEAMELVGQAMKKSSNDRNDLVNQLVGMQDFETPLGNVTFDSTRIAKRKMPIFTLEAGGNIVEQ